MNPYLDMPSVEDECCEVANCKEERAWQTGEGRWLCEHHASKHLRGERVSDYDHAEYLREINWAAEE